MTRDEWINYIMETYAADMNRPWARTPENIVVRHTSNRKWIALFMTIPRRFLGLDGDEPIDVMNCKCDPMMIGALRREPGFYPAYHMSKTHWITAALDGSADEDRIRMLIDMSYEATNTNVGQRVLRCSICTGEQVAGFREIATGHYEEITLIRGAADLEQFRKDYGIIGEIEKEN